MYQNCLAAAINRPICDSPLFAHVTQSSATNNPAIPASTARTGENLTKNAPAKIPTAATAFGFSSTNFSKPLIKSKILGVTFSSMVWPNASPFCFKITHCCDNLAEFSAPLWFNLLILSALAKKAFNAFSSLTNRLAMS